MSSSANLLMAADAYTMGWGRVGAILATLTALSGVIIGALTLARRFEQQRGAMYVTVSGLVGMAVGALVVVTSNGGLGTGNGRGGGYFALILSSIALVLAGIVWRRSRAVR
ncbi:MAG: hypothetical protein HOQ05_07660 [Corynebacteriales bacterium]|nr:hypothetical protein [Mycobacteriales bacterium]